MKYKIYKVAKLALQIVTGVAVVVIVMYATAVRPANVEEDLAPTLMEEYHVDSFEELANYGH